MCGHHFRLFGHFVPEHPLSLQPWKRENAFPLLRERGLRSCVGQAYGLDFQLLPCYTDHYAEVQRITKDTQQIQHPDSPCSAFHTKS